MKKNIRKTIPFMVKNFVFRRDNYRCIVCGASSADVRLHIDHIVPVSKGGTDELDNLMTLCEECNLGKSDKLINPIIKDVDYMRNYIKYSREYIKELQNIIDESTTEINKLTKTINEMNERFSK